MSGSPAVGCVLAFAALLAGPGASAAALTVCPQPAADCRYVGMDGIAQAIDRAADGDVVRLRPGRYHGTGYRDVRFEALTIRGRLLIEGKAITIRGEPGAELDLGAGAPASAIVVHRGRLSLEGITVRDARPAAAEDDVYDGHGVFLVDATASLRDVTFRRIAKMAVAVRGRSTLEASAVRLLDGHVGLWVEEAAAATLTDCLIAGNDSAGVAAYADARVSVSGCVFEANGDDALYAAERAMIEADDTLFLRNGPFALRAVDQGRIAVTASAFYDNAAVHYPATNATAAPGVRTSGAVTVTASRVFPDYCSAQALRQPLPESAPGCSQ